MQYLSAELEYEPIQICSSLEFLLCSIFVFERLSNYKIVIHGKFVNFYHKYFKIHTYNIYFIVIFMDYSKEFNVLNASA